VAAENSFSAFPNIELINGSRTLTLNNERHLSGENNVDQDNEHKLIKDKNSSNININKHKKLHNKILHIISILMIILK